MHGESHGQRKDSGGLQSMGCNEWDTTGRQSTWHSFLFVYKYGCLYGFSFAARAVRGKNKTVFTMHAQM